MLSAALVLLLQSTAAFGGTVFYYRFDGSTLNDSTGTTAQNGTMSGGSATYSNSVPGGTVPLTGQSNTQSISLGGADYPKFNFAFPFDTLANATLEFWVNPSVLNSENDLFWTTNDGGDANRFNIFLGSGDGDGNTNHFRLDYREPGGALHALLDVKNAVTVGQWTFVAITKSTATYSVFLGHSTSAAGSGTDSSPNLPNSTGWTLDGRSISGNCGSCGYTGLMDEIRLSDTVLDPSQFLIAGSDVPEPSSIWLLIGGAILIARRRVMRTA